MKEPVSDIQSSRRKGIYLFPNLVTTGVLFAGFYGIVAAIDGNYPRSALALFIAMVLDGLDGRLARLTGTESDFGKEYDSLADLVAFGVAPAIIVYQWGLVRLVEYGWIWGKLGWLAAFLYAVSAALRLARFNVMPASVDRRFFEGLPSPSAAALVTFMVWLATDLDWSGGVILAVACVITPIAGVLMVSHLSFYSFKEIEPGSRISYTFSLAIPLTLVLIFLDPPKVLFMMAAGYAISGPLVSLWLYRRKVNDRDDDQAATGT
jgi:CDP-diacylglycerol--serine O-phosphatidyltransferase